MIDQQTGLQAYVAKYDEDNEFSTKYYYEYIAPPESPFFSPNANVRYIEAVDGERYELVLIIPSSYYFGTNTHVQVIYQVNGKTYLVDQLARPKAPAQLESRFSTTFLEVGGIMQRAGLKFPELRGRTESDISPNHTEQAKPAECGKIDINIQLGRAQDLETGVKFFPVNSASQERPWKVAVEVGTSHNAATIEDNATQGLVWKGREWTSSRAQYGKVKFAFCYATRTETLEIKKVVPIPKAVPKLSSKTEKKPALHKSVNKQMRPDDDAEDDEEPSLPVKKEKQAGLTQSTKRMRRDEEEDPDIDYAAQKKIKSSEKVVHGQLSSASKDYEVPKNKIGKVGAVGPDRLASVPEPTQDSGKARAKIVVADDKAGVPKSAQDGVKARTELLARDDKAAQIEALQLQLQNLQRSLRQILDD